MGIVVLAVGIFVLAIVIFSLDLLLPTGGVLAVVAGFLAVVAIVCGFRYSFNTGLLFILATLIALPVMLLSALEIWPRTPFGKRMIVEPLPAEEFVWSDAAKTSDVRSLIGAIGEAASEMLPSGKVRIGDQSFEAFSEAGPIAKGKPVKVLRLDVGRLVVIEVRDPITPTPSATGTGLDRPANELDIESLDG